MKPNKWRWLLNGLLGFLATVLVALGARYLRLGLGDAGSEAGTEVALRLVLSIVLILLGAALAFSIKKSIAFRQILVLGLVATYFALVLGNYLYARATRNNYLDYPSVQAAHAQGLPWDRRTRLQVVLDTRKAQPSTFPTVSPSLWLQNPLIVGGQPTVPLGGVANTWTVGCNESGYYNAYQSDRYGLENPDSVWDLPSWQVAFVGDSFTQGHCVSPEDSAVGRVRAQFPATVNLAYGGNGPLIELATLREFLSEKRTGVVFWMYTPGNVRSRLVTEGSSSVLRQYLDPAYSQKIPAREGDISQALARHVEADIRRQLPRKGLLDRLPAPLTLAHCGMLS